MKQSLHYFIYILSFLGLILTLIPSVLVFQGQITLSSHKFWMLIGMLLWFIPMTWKLIQKQSK